MAEAPEMAESPVERWPPTLQTQVEPKPGLQLAAPHARLLAESKIDELIQN